MSKCKLRSLLCEETLEMRSVDKDRILCLSKPFSDCKAFPLMPAEIPLHGAYKDGPPAYVL